MTDQQSFDPRNLDCSVADVVRALAGKGRIQVSVRTECVLHERQGEISGLREEGARVYILGDYQSSWIETSAVQRIVAQVDVSRHGRSLPRVTFIGAGDQRLMALTGLGDGDAFLAAISALPFTQAEPVLAWPRPLTPVSVEDSGLSGLQAVAGKNISIRMNLPGVQSSWTGPFDEARIGENFVNVSRPGFHLHLRGGAVTRWEDEDGCWHAIGQDGQRLGLSVERDVS